MDNWRWQGVPFYLRTGKRLPMRVSEAFIQFTEVPHRSFPAHAVSDWEPNRLMLRIQPDEAILLRFQAKQPGQLMCISPVKMAFYYEDAFDVQQPEAYENLLLDVMNGDQTLFMRADQIEASWAAISPVLEDWGLAHPTDFPNYDPGSWGPATAERLIKADGRRWFTPTLRAGDREEWTKDADPDFTRMWSPKRGRGGAVRPERCRGDSAKGQIRRMPRGRHHSRPRL